MFVHAQSIGRVSRPVFSECTLPSLVLWWRMQHRGLKASEGRHCRGVEPLDFSRIRQIAECSRLLAQSRLPLYLVSIIEYVYCLNMVEKHCQNYHHRSESIRALTPISFVWISIALCMCTSTWLIRPHIVFCSFAIYKACMRVDVRRVLIQRNKTHGSFLCIRHSRQIYGELYRDIPAIDIKLLIDISVQCRT